MVDSLRDRILLNNRASAISVKLSAINLTAESHCCPVKC